MDKSKVLVTNVRLVNDRLNFEGSSSGNKPISVDYIPPFGDNLGYTSLELLLISLSTCIGSAVLIFLRKMQKTISTIEISSEGFRRVEHPTGFDNIRILIELKSPDTSEDDLRKVISLAEDKYCPVWSMIRGNVKVDIAVRINEEK